VPDQRLENPYEVGNPVTGNQFYGRQDILEDLRNILTHRVYNIIFLYGQPRIGKSSLLYRLESDEHLRQECLPVYLSMQSHETARFAPARVLDNLAETIRDEIDPDFSLLPELDLTADYTLFHRAFLREVYSHLDGRRILFLIDEFDVVVPPVEAVASPAQVLLSYLDTLIQEEKEHLAFVFVISKRLELLPEGHQRLARRAHFRQVVRLRQNETRRLLTELGAKVGLSYSQEALEAIWGLTSGHPFLTQSLGSEIFAHLTGQLPAQAMADDVRVCLDGALESGHGMLVWLWAGIEAEHKLTWILSAVAELSDRDRGATDAEINEALEQHLLPLDAEDREEAYERLLQDNYLSESERRYQFVVDFIRLWVSKHHPLIEFQRQIEASSPDAENYYQLATEAYRAGFLEEANKYYRQGLKLDPGSVKILLGLAVVLRAQQHFDEAIEITEQAYEKDSELAGSRLVRIRLRYASELQTQGDDEGTLEQTERVLVVDSENVEARQFVSDIRLRRSEAYLSENNFKAALREVDKLAKYVPLAEEPSVGQRLRQRWLEYSQRITDQGPNWTEAQEVLGSLERYDLLDEEVLAAYNQATLNKAKVFLEKQELEPAVASLRDGLKHPLPEREIKDTLLGYSDRQMKGGDWERADQALTGLCDILGDDKETQNAHSNLLQQWGDILVESKKFDQAIDVYRRGRSKESKSRIANAFLSKAAWQLEQHQLAEAESSYQQALATQKNRKIRAEASGQIQGYFDKRRKDHDWERAQGALDILKRHELLAESKIAVMGDDLRLDQARTELARGHLNEAFQILTEVRNEAKEAIKKLVQDYIQQKATQHEWPVGRDVLERLRERLPDDPDTVAWLANWLLLWADDLFSRDRSDRQPVQASELCREALDLATENTPYLDLLHRTESLPDTEQTSLQRRACVLLADILLEQAQTAIDKNDLAQLREHIDEALDLPCPPEGLKQRIQDRLYTLARRHIQKERWEDYRKVRQFLEDRGLDDPDMTLMLKKIQTHHAFDELKDDRPERAFEILRQQNAGIGQAIKTDICDFSWRYAGQDKWTLAQDTLVYLDDLLKDLGEAGNKEIVGWLDDLHRERLAFVRGKYRSPTVSDEELKRLEEELDAAEMGYLHAKDSVLDSVEAWSQDFIQAGLAQGAACLGKNDLRAASQAYRKILHVDSRQASHVQLIIHALYGFSEHAFERENWDKAREAINLLVELGLVNTHDPRADGAIQRILLSKANKRLEEHQVLETFEDVLAQVPRPRPTRDIKILIDTYSRERREKEDWPRAIDALRRLNQFLKEDRTGPYEDEPSVWKEEHHNAYDNEAVTWLVEGLVAWGTHLKASHAPTDLDKAGVVYRQALKWARRTEPPQNFKIAREYYIPVALELAWNRMTSDTPGADRSLAFRHAIRRYRIILDMEEHEPHHESQINDALYKYAVTLKDAGQWAQVHQTLDELEKLYQDRRDDYEQQFAAWRLELAREEIHSLLSQQEFEPVFQSLRLLKEEWLPQSSTSQISWPTSRDEIKDLVYQDFCKTWLDKHEWELALPALQQLAELIPDDNQVWSWQVHALCEWGAWLRDQGHLPESQARHEEALSLALEQQLTTEEVAGDLVKIAQRYLSRNELDAAIVVYRLVLDRCGRSAERDEDIRQALKAYSDHAAAGEDWVAAHRALHYLVGSSLNNKHVLNWRWTLILQEMDFWLQEHDDLDAAFATLGRMEQPWRIDKVRQVIHGYWQARVTGENWQKGLEALKRLAAKSGDTALMRNWLMGEYTDLAQVLEETKREEEAGVVLGEAYEFGKAQQGD
jgi:Tfp pilus assembly protein PilF